MEPLEASIYAAQRFRESIMIDRRNSYGVNWGNWSG